MPLSLYLHTSWHIYFLAVVRRNRKVRNPLTHHIQRNATTRDIVSTRTEMKKRTRERNGRSTRRFRIRSFTKYQLNTNNDERRRAKSPRRRIMEIADDEESSSSLSNWNETPLDWGGEIEDENGGDPVLHSIGVIVFTFRIFCFSHVINHYVVFENCHHGG